MDKTKTSDNGMNVYIGLTIVAFMAVCLSAYLPFQTSDKSVSILMIIVSTIFSMTLTFVITMQWRKKIKDERIRKIEAEHEKKIHMMEKKHDTTNLEKTIREGTLALIKNALEYFKLENIKNEIGESAAIENLQLDKYGQIIELLAEFSLILPDVTESQKIVQQELTHQIQIYQMDERPFSLFLQRIMDKYLITVHKKMLEKVSEKTLGLMKTCPRCRKRVLHRANICKYCRYEFRALPDDPVHSNMALGQVEGGRKLYYGKNYKEAIRAFTRAIELKPNFAIAYYNRAICHYKINNNEAAKKDLKRASSMGHSGAEKLLKKMDRKKERQGRVMPPRYRN